MTKRGYCGVGIFYAKHDTNLGTLFRSAYAFGADFIFTVGRPYKTQSSDTTNSCRHIPYFHYVDYDDFKQHTPKGARPIVIELDSKSHQLKTFVHPERAIYILGSEAGNLPKELLERNTCLQIDSRVCLNVAVAGSIVLAHRQMQRG